ncbi:hypothetical protein V1L52_07680 [Treponema sp. HNW]|uniref:hypothetical protein n=1 Tax=Treponema sp. HNW TaxID=3116654 RepID=UPI003D0A7C01
MILILAMCVSCSKNTGKSDTIDIPKEPEKTEVQIAAEAQQVPEVQDIFEADIFMNLPDSPLAITEECTVKELSDVEVFSLDEKSGMKASVSGIYDSVVAAESEKFTILYTVYRGTYKLCYAAFYAQTPLNEKWSGYIDTPSYDILAAFGTPYEIQDNSPIVMSYKKDIWLTGEGLTSICIQFYYENKRIQKVALWKQR